MKISTRYLATVFVAIAGLLASASAQQDPGPTPEPGRVELTAALITRDLLIRPIPKQRFLIVPETAPSAEPVAEIVTGFDGAASAELAPGSYRIVSEAPLEWEDRRLRWDALPEDRF